MFVVRTVIRTTVDCAIWCVERSLCG